MYFGSDEHMIIDIDEEGELGFYPVDTVKFSVDTEWFFEGTWVSFLGMTDVEFPRIDIGEPMCSEDDDGALGVWVRLDCGGSAIWLRLMTFAPDHWVWGDEEYH